MYDNSWYNSGDIVPDQVPPASDATPLVDSGTGVAGTSTEYSRGDHKHPLQVSDVLPSKDISVGTVGQASSYARSDHQHPIQTVDIIPNSDSADGSYGTVDSYSRNDQSHPINVQTNASIVPVVNGVRNNGTSAYYSRHDHIHPQQLIYDGNVTATKFIKSGGLSTEVLCANGDTTTIGCKLSRSYSSGAGGYIRLYVFPIGTSTGAPYMQFQVTCNTYAMQTTDLVPNYTVNGIADLYSAFTAPSYVQPAYNIYYGADQLLHTHTGSYSTAEYTARVNMMSGSGSVTVTVSNQSSYMTNRITEIPTQDIVSSISGSQTQIPISYNLGNGGIINNMIQVNPMNRSYTTYNNGCDTTFINTTKAAQWEISKTNDNALTINPSSLRQADHSVAQYSRQIQGQWAAGIMIRQDIISQQFVICLTSDFGNDDRGLRISADGNTLTFNGSVIAGTGATNGATNGSVNYSAGNPILWGANSVDTDGGFNSNGNNVFWRAHSLTMESVPP
ncbi:MAG: hypothetical protein EZS28_023075 [Streblomastix strix]|uniref:Uncharacterized protein n=1 Tax=Streblomastix strix TaxID=222440 RepID=A0A5J4VGE0_9EUKA|nr:MAG: hypothetical protein EZS28_023075 [Streblomastix strix]